MTALQRQSSADRPLTALVSGASSGLGEEIARVLAQRGHDLVLVARREDRLLALAGELSAAHGIRAQALSCDLSQASQRDDLVERLTHSNLEIGILVNNAGLGQTSRICRKPERQLELVRVNAEAVVALCRAFVPAMVQRRHGAILNVASLAALKPIPYQATYSASKAFVLHFSEALREELRGTGVAVTVLCPGPMPTEFLELAGMAEDLARLPPALWRLVPSLRVTAEAGVAGLERNRRRVVPGPANRAAGLTLDLLPTGLALRILGRFGPKGGSAASSGSG